MTVAMVQAICRLSPLNGGADVCNLCPLWCVTTEGAFLFLCYGSIKERQVWTIPTPKLKKAM